MKNEKKTLTVEELKKACEEAKNNFDALNEQLKKAIEEEEERKQAQLALDKESRKKEVDGACKTYRKLLKEYIKDYGAYSLTTDTSDADLFPNVFWRSFF